MSAEEVEVLKKENDELKNKILQLENKNDLMQSKIEEQAKEIRDLDHIKQKCGEEQKRLKAETCDENCVLCVMVWFCAKKESLPHICGRQLEKIIVVTALTREDIKIENRKDLVKCSNLIEVLQKCNLVILENVYNYPSKSVKNARKKEIDKAWNELMSIDGSKEHVIMGRTKCKELGHVEICDLAERADGRITIHDPQKTQRESFNLDREQFGKRVRDDTGLYLYSVKWKELQQMIYCYADIFHYGEKSARNEACTHCCSGRHKKKKDNSE